MRAVMPRIIIDGGRALVDAVRQRDEARGRHDAQLGIGAFRHAGIGDAIADREARHVGPDRLDHAGAFEPDAGRETT